jgi:hypothetical protein
METDVSNFFFKECKASMADGITRVLLSQGLVFNLLPKEVMIIVQAIEAKNRKNLVKSITGQYIL